MNCNVENEITWDLITKGGKKRKEAINCDMNRLSHQSFAEAVINLLDKSRGKFRNILLVGPVNSAKTFLLQPLVTND